jgi:hypothetical protein
MSLEEKIIQLCGFADSSYLIFSENVYEPIIYYSHLLAFFATFLIGAIVYLKGKPSLARHFLIGVCAMICVWTFSNLVLWASRDVGTLFFFWSLTIISEPLLYFF